MQAHTQHLSQEALSYSGLLAHNNKSNNTEANANYRAKDCIIHSDLSHCFISTCLSTQASTFHPSGPVPALQCSLTKSPAQCAHSPMPQYTVHSCHLLVTSLCKWDGVDRRAQTDFRRWHFCTIGNLIINLAFSSLPFSLSIL